MLRRVAHALIVDAAISAGNLTLALKAATLAMRVPITAAPAVQSSQGPPRLGHRTRELTDSLMDAGNRDRSAGLPFVRLEVETLKEDKFTIELGQLTKSGGSSKGFKLENKLTKHMALGGFRGLLTPTHPVIQGCHPQSGRTPAQSSADN